MLGIPFATLDAAGALAEVERLYERDEPGFVVHANVHTVTLATEDPAYADVLRRADLVLNDGKGVMLGARIKGARFPIDLNGNMFTPLLLERAAQRGWSVFFFGAKPGVADRAAEVVRRSIPDLEIAGTRNGYFKPDEEAAVVADIKAASPDVLLVGLGNPRQEQWLDRNLASTGARLGVGIGAFFDFQTGEVKRAPAWMNRYGLEWVHRLGAEPKRMWRRYLVGNPQFLARVVKERRNQKRSGS
jgi:N-acetylglucosaminyldiphosphoundecaprenol N-acetyl-beta-D-mannosaminyltransferase